MPYQYLDDVATADVAFKATGETLEEMFIAAADATMNLMVEDLLSVARQHTQAIHVEDENLEMLLFNFLQELVYYKDAEKLLLRVPKIEIKSKDNNHDLTAEAYGEVIDPKKHQLNVDIKAVTFHRFEVRKVSNGWESTVVLDI